MCPALRLWKRLKVSCLLRAANWPPRTKMKRRRQPESSLRPVLHGQSAMPFSNYDPSNGDHHGHTCSSRCSFSDLEPATAPAAAPIAAPVATLPPEIAPMPAPKAPPAKRALTAIIRGTTSHAECRRSQYGQDNFLHCRSPKVLKYIRATTLADNCSRFCAGTGAPLGSADSSGLRPSAPIAISPAFWPPPPWPGATGDP